MIQDGGLSTNGVMEASGIKEDRVKATVLVSEDERPGGVTATAHVVQSKGVGDGWIAKGLWRSSGAAGPTRQRIPSIVELQRAAIQQSDGALTTLMKSPVGEVESRGKVGYCCM